MDLLNVSTRNDLAWLNDPEEWSFTGETGVVITAPPVTDFFCDPASVNVQRSAPLLYKEFQGDFQLTTKTSVDMVSQYDASCLMLWLDAENWVKLCFEFDGSNASIVSVVTRNGSSDDCNHCIVKTREISLRMIRLGKVVSLFFSQDDVHWNLMRYLGFEIPGSFRIGIEAQSPIGSGTQARFSYLDLAEAPTQARFS